MAYATFSRGYKSGGVNYPIYSTPSGIEPEILDMYEIGLKGDYLDNTLRLNAAVFFYDYSDLQVQRPAGSGAGTTVENAADAEIWGLDVDATWVISDAFSLRAGLSALDSEYTEYTAIATVRNAYVLGVEAPGGRGVDYDASGESLLKAPDLSYFVTANYDLNVGTGTVPMSVTWSWKDDTTFDFPVDPVWGPYMVQDSYGLLSARISYLPADERWSVGVWGRNLTDEEYFNELAANAMGMRGGPGDPRTYGVDFQFNF